MAFSFCGSVLVGRTVGGLRGVLWGLIALCVFLSGWQVYRLFWKQDLLRTLEARGSQLLSESSLQDDAQLAFYRLHLAGQWLHTSEKHVPRYREQAWGVCVMTPLVLASGRRLWVDRGWTLQKALPHFPRPQGWVQVEGVLMPSEQATWGAPPLPPADAQVQDGDPALWARRDLKAMGQGAFHHVYLQTSFTDGKVPMPRNPHLGYALTWFALAVALGFAGRALPQRRTP